jgi:dephospho-CoA kinase
VAPEKTRIQRVMQRDGISKAEVIKRINNQWPDDDKLKLANFVIENDGNKMILPQVLEIHRQLTYY